MAGTEDGKTQDAFCGVMLLDASAPAIARALRGIGTMTARLARQAEPLRGIDLLEIIDALGFAPIDRCDAALLALGYVIGLRRSELVGLDLETLGDGAGTLPYDTTSCRSRAGPFKDKQ